VIGSSLSAYAQDAPITKDQILQMVKFGLPDDVVVSKINASATPPTISTDDLIALKSAGVGDSIIRALVSPAPKAGAAALAPAPAQTVAAPADPNDPMVAHDPGIYLLITDRAGGKKMVLIERAGSGHEKTSNVWGSAFTYGIAKAKLKAEIPGPHATVRSDDAKPEFYMYFPPTGNLGAADTISSPSQFSLLLLDSKKDHRETTVAKAGLGSYSAGSDNSRTFKFTATKIRPYAYKVGPDSNLKDGEYAFIAATGMGGAAAASSVVVFDFGVDFR
jgi:hypothetical protein